MMLPLVGKLALLHCVSLSLSFNPARVGWTHPAKERVVPRLLELYSTPTRRKPSLVTDEDGPTPNGSQDQFEEIDVDSIPELHEIERASDMPPGPIPHQTWRRGETNGCEDPITADWRVEAEDIIAKAAKLAGGKVIDVTWFLTSVYVTLDEDLSAAKDLLKASGPVIDVRQSEGPMYYDPADPNPEEIWADEEGIVYVRETEEEREARRQRELNRWAKPENPDEPRIPEGFDVEQDIYMNEMTRGDLGGMFPEELEALARIEDEGTPITEDIPIVDTAALSTVAGAIIAALQDAEPKLRVLSRHELVLGSPGPPDVLETQKQFDANRGEKVVVETQDPWESNRVLKGRLLDRNSMDVLINKKGRMVTIPLNFVKCVKIELPEETGAESVVEIEEDELE